MNVEIAERLAARRREAGLSQEALAEKLGVTRQAVSKWERSESSPDTDNLIALAQLYGVSLDNLLYVDGSIRDDVAFETQDRMEQRRAAATAAAGSGSAYATTGSATSDHSPFASSDPAGDFAKDSSAKNNSDQDYVHINWHDGIHVKDSKTGEEVHVSWDGIHIVDNPRHEDEGSGGATVNATFAIGDDDGDDDGGGGDSVHWAPGRGVDINGTHYGSWKEARAHSRDQSWFVIDDWKRSGKSSWMKFPFALLALLAYLLVGLFLGAWGWGLFIFFSVPLYHMLIGAIVRRKPSMFLIGIYPLLAIAWFFWMAFPLNQPHPAWVIFLTIPLYEWLVISLRNWLRRRKQPTSCLGDATSSGE